MVSSFISEEMIPINSILNLSIYVALLTTDIFYDENVMIETKVAKKTQTNLVGRDRKEIMRGT